MSTRPSLAIRAGSAALVLLTLAAVSAGAQDYRRGPARPEHFDARYNHNRYYADRGMTVRAIPGRPYAVGGGRYYYSGGVWYAPRGPRFVVIGAPVGFFVPVLPPFYNTVWFGGVPYYYANDTYYMWRADQNGYEVVAPPAEAAQSNVASTQAPPSDELFIYPQNGQSAEQQASDKYECHKWANTQTGYDPTQAAGGVGPDQAESKRADYQRAMRACLEGRGYSVR
jgi:Family of unknown function (DUF6515)